MDERSKKIKGAHFYVDTDGTTYQTASLNTSVAHLYSSSSKQMYPEYYNVLFNTNTVGIEVIGTGLDANEKSTNGDVEKGQTPLTGWESLTGSQAQATSILVQQIKNHYNVHCDNIYAHEKVQRKTAGEGQTVLNSINFN